MAAARRSTRLDEVSRAPWAGATRWSACARATRQRLSRSSAIAPGRGPRRAPGAGRLSAAAACQPSTQSAGRSIALRDEGVISDEVLHQLEQELDVEAMLTGIGEVRLT